jgi:hypothetical protein
MTVGIPQYLLGSGHLHKSLIGQGGNVLPWPLFRGPRVVKAAERLGTRLDPGVGQCLGRVDEAKMR